jgi:tRNA dimethylallyltransferase
MIAKPVIIISGPTATGKSSLAIDIAKKAPDLFHRQAEVINFDSLLFYKELNIGTAKPDLQEQGDVVHHMIDISTAKSPLNAADFSEMALIILKKLQKNNIIPILVGGSGFYLRALVKGMIEAPNKDPNLVNQARQLYEQEGIAPIIDYLKQHDPTSLKTLHLNDHYRLMRAYEYHLQTGSMLSLQKNLIEQNRPYDFSSHQLNSSSLYHLYLNIPPKQHWSIIEERTRKMHAQGLLEEVRELVKLGFSSNDKPLDSIGYKQSLLYLQGHYANDAAFLEAINIATRQLAKAQRTFFQKIVPKFEYHPLMDQDKIWSDLVNWCNSGEVSGG